MRYKTILFDADGTLLDFHRGEREAVREALLMSGIDADDEQIRVYSEINDGLWKMLERGEIDRSVLLYRRFELFCERYGYTADARRIATDYMYTLSTKGYLLKGVSDMLERLFGKVRMYIITNGVEVIQRGRYARADIGRYFEDIFISEALGYQKPDVRYFELVAERIEGFNKAETLVVGDSLTADIKGGNAFGVDTCRYDPTRSPISGDIRPTYSAGSFEEICDIILGRNECGE